MKQFKIAAPLGAAGILLLLLFVSTAVNDQLLLKIRNLQQQAAR